MADQIKNALCDDEQPPDDWPDKMLDAVNRQMHGAVTSAKQMLEYSWTGLKSGNLTVNNGECWPLKIKKKKSNTDVASGTTDNFADSWLVQKLRTQDFFSFNELEQRRFDHPSEITE